MSGMGSEENTRRGISPKKQAQILRQILEQELTDSQRHVFLEYHFAGKSMYKMAKELGVHKSTISRTLRRAEAHVKKFTAYVQIGVDFSIQNFLNKENQL